MSLPETELSILHSAAHGRQCREERQIEKIDLQRARRYGMKEKARNGRLKYTYGGVVFIYDPVSNSEVTSYKSRDNNDNYMSSSSLSSGTKVAKPIILPKVDDVDDEYSKAVREIHRQALLKKKGSWKSHSILVVDMSGSMRRDDVNGARCRSDGIWMSLARDYVEKPLKMNTRDENDLISIIIMKEAAHVLFEFEPTDWVLYNKLIDMRDWMLLKPQGHGNYMPALDAAERLLMKNAKGSCALSLLFFSDGKPSDKGNVNFARRMGDIASKFGRRLTIACIGMAEEGEDFSTLNEMVTEAQSFGSIASFGKPTLDADSLSNIISSLATSLTTTITEMTNINTGKAREVRMDVRREKSDAPNENYLTDDWTPYTNATRLQHNRYVATIWSWDYKRDDFVQYIDSRCSRCWKETDALDSLSRKAVRGIVCPLCTGHCFCIKCYEKSTSAYFSECSTYQQDLRVGKIVRKVVPTFDVAIKDTIFGEGAERIVRKFRFLQNERVFIGPVMVAKESRFLEKSGTKSYEKRMDYHREFMRTQAIASEYAKKFNKALESIVHNFHESDHYYIQRKINEIPKIEFLEAMVVETIDPSKEQSLYNILVEPLLEGKYEKFNDNMGMVQGQAQSVRDEDLLYDKKKERDDVNDLIDQFSRLTGLGAIEEGSEEEDEEDGNEEDIIEAEHSKKSKNGNYNFAAIQKEFIPQAFSHFTYENSKKHFMVVDLQGVLKENQDGTSVYHLTDPVIHKRRRKKSQKFRNWSFGRTDRGEKGMKAFFHTHKCNDLCRLLGLEQHN